MLKKSAENIKHDNEIATDLVRRFIGRPVRGVTTLAGGAVGLGIGAPVGIASLFFGGGRSRGGDYDPLMGAPLAVALPVITTGAGGLAGNQLGRGVSEVVTQVVGGTLGGVASILLAIPRRVAPYVTSNNQDQAAENRRVIEAERSEAYRRANQQFQENGRRVESRGQAEQQPSSYSYYSQVSPRPAAPPALTELEVFLNERQQYNNRKRLYQALFDLDNIAETSLEFVTVQQEITPFLQNKIGQRFEEYQDAIVCRIEMDVPNDPITIPSDGPQRHMMGFEMLKGGTPNHLWTNKQYRSPMTRAEGAHTEIEPAYATQSLIERLIVRSYEFREQREVAKGVAHAHENAIKRYHGYLNTRPTNQARLDVLLAGKGTMNEFLEFYLCHDSFNATFGEHSETVTELLIGLYQLGSLPRMPVINNNRLCDYPENSRASEITIAYDVQNVIEQVLLAARTLSQEFVNSKRQEQSNRI